MNSNQVAYLIVIAPREQKDKLLNELHDKNANFLNVMFGHGSLDGSKFATLFSFATEPRKVVITAFVLTSEVNEILATLEDKFNFNQANTGFAFTIPIERINH
ncbi:MAG TPA: hypothetical protein PKO28_02710 [Bacilli bacterium]|nr:hypothetical protein [Bacilli bacterium]